MAGRHRAGCDFADQQTDIGDTTEEFAVARGVRTINSVCQDCDGVAAVCERRAMGSALDAVRAARNNDPLGGSQVGG